VIHLVFSAARALVVDDTLRPRAPVARDSGRIAGCARAAQGWFSGVRATVHPSHSARRRDWYHSRLRARYGARRGALESRGRALRLLLLGALSAVFAERLFRESNPRVVSREA